MAETVCYAIQPGNWGPWVPVCDRPVGHEGPHECNTMTRHDAPWWWPKRHQWEK